MIQWDGVKGIISVSDHSCMTSPLNKLTTTGWSGDGEGEGTGSMQ